MIRFSESLGHKYESIEPDDRKWSSVSTLISALKQPFDEYRISEACAKKKDSKWYGLTGQQIRDLWEAERNRSIELGKWYHWRKEIAEDPVNMCIVKDGWKYAMDQKLGTGIYPEAILYLAEHSICGQADRIVVDGNKFSIHDYKTNKVIQATAYQGKRMKFPMNRYDDVNLNHYALQLSLYAYMVKQHNPKLELDKLVIEHIRFKVRYIDKYDYPVLHITGKGEYVVRDVTPIKVPYLENDVKNVLKHLDKVLEGKKTTQAV